MTILFDLDGTLTDPFEGITKSISHALVALGRKLPRREDLQWCIGPPLKNSFGKLLDTDDEKLLDKALSLYRERFGSIGLFENKVYEGIYEVLETLQEKGHALHIATSKPKVYAERIVNHFNMNRYFKNIYGSELDGTRSDKKDLLAYILKSESIASSGTFMIGDREHDMIGAKANGISGIGVLWGYDTKEALETSGAHVCIGHPKELILKFD